MVALLFLATLAAPGDAPPSAGDGSYPLQERTFRVGMIFIEGADDMGASAILNELDFRSGDRIAHRRLRDAERRLGRLGLFVTDPASGVRPRLIPLCEGDVSDVRVVVVRRPGR